jgi:HEAT repeat protein
VGKKTAIILVLSLLILGVIALGIKSLIEKLTPSVTGSIESYKQGREKYLETMKTLIRTRGGEKVLEMLLTQLEDKDALIRINSAWTLGELGYKPALPILKRQLKKENVDLVRKEIKSAIEKLETN